ncbi:PRC-barrel domain-containing protein [Roseovarius sp. Pro17]|uniref:PRC-barrel domain-containing protein n=1 Tax=Roseovarius sp. Pro17 TaxID=3108175 RepID=UPI002D776C9D|nr:PRC-barrel domain-containing protein [Roseovarius sp. Pro17]
MLQSDGADVDVKAAEEEAEVNISQTDDAEVNVEQGEAVIEMQDYEADDSGKMKTEKDRAVYNDNVTQNPISQMLVGDLTGMNVLSESGEDVGEIDNIGLRGDTIVAIIGVGGFLGLGEREVALPVDRQSVRDGAVYLPKTSEAELKNMPEYNDSEVVMSDGNGTIADLLGS